YLERRAHAHGHHIALDQAPRRSKDTTPCCHYPRTQVHPRHSARPARSLAAKKQPYAGPREPRTSSYSDPRSRQKPTLYEGVPLTRPGHSNPLTSTPTWLMPNRHRCKALDYERVFVGR